MNTRTDRGPVRWRRQVGWNPTSRHWRIASLFMCGSVVFAIGSFPLYFRHLPPGVVGATFVVGALIFTAAAASAFLEVINDDDPPRARRWAWQPHRNKWWAAFVQLAGTLFFNVSTVDAMIDNLSAVDTNKLVWAPDMFGSICFLIASHLGWLAVRARDGRESSDRTSWWIAVLNYVGSVFFMIAAFAAITLRTTGEELNTALVNSGTLAGAVSFFVAAYLLLPPR